MRHKAAFRCCRCQNIGIDVHHIIPEQYNGTNDIDNAAPLCQNCHDQFGDNLSKRKEIKQMRDWWYRKCKEMYPSRMPNEFDLLNKIDTKLERIQHGQEDISDVKEILRNIANQTIEGISPQNAASGASTIVNAVTAVRLGPDTFSNFYCSKCNTQIGLIVGTDVCPICKAKIKYP